MKSSSVGNCVVRQELPVSDYASKTLSFRQYYGEQKMSLCHYNYEEFKFWKLSCEDKDAYFRQCFEDFIIQKVLWGAKKSLCN